MLVWLANPRGFCAGVERAIEIVERALAEHGPPVYVRHRIVHNARVVERLAARGAVFVQDVEDVPPGAVTVFSAHGVAPGVERAAAHRGLDVVDATCPLVEKVHRAARRHAAQGCDVVVVGHAGHPEVVGTVGQVGAHVHVVGSVAEVESLVVRDPARVGYVTQTTLAVDETRAIVAALEARFPGVRGAATRDICYATHNRQQAVRELAARCDAVLVIGDDSSSNSNRLREIATQCGRPARLVASAAALEHDWLVGVRALGLTAGASAPEELVAEVLARLGQWFELEVREVPGRSEEVVMPLPARFARRRTAGRVHA